MSHLPLDEARLRPHLRQPVEKRRPAEAQAKGVDATSPGWKVPVGDDLERLRGLPAIGRNVSGAIRGSDPARETIKRSERRGR